MRKKSIEQVKKDYKVSPENRKSLTAASTAINLKESVAVLKDSGKTMTAIAESMKKTADKSTSNIEKILDNHLASLREMFKPAPVTKKEWEIDSEVTKRNKEGFISRIKVFVKQI